MPKTNSKDGEVMGPLKRGLTIWGRFFKAVPIVLFRTLKEKFFS